MPSYHNTLKECSMCGTSHLYDLKKVQEINRSPDDESNLMIKICCHVCRF